MAITGKREKGLLWVASIPMWLLALSCLYPIYFALNNALKTDKGYILNRFSIVTDPTVQNFVNAWNRSHLGDYFFNSVVTTAGAVALLLIVSEVTPDATLTAVCVLSKKLIVAAWVEAEQAISVRPSNGADFMGDDSCGRGCALQKCPLPITACHPPYRNVWLIEL